MKNIGEDHVQAATSLARTYGINYVTPTNVNTVVAAKRTSLAGEKIDKNTMDRIAGDAFPNRTPPVPDSNYRNHVGNLLW